MQLSTIAEIAFLFGLFFVALKMSNNYYRDEKKFGHWLFTIYMMVVVLFLIATKIWQ